MQLAAAKRAFDELHKDAPFHDGMEKIWSKEWSPDTPFHYLDGTTLWLAEYDVNPDDKFLGGQSSSDVNTREQAHSAEPR